MCPGRPDPFGDRVYMEVEMRDKKYNHFLKVRRIEFKIQRLKYRRAALEACLLPPAIRYDKDKVQVTPSDKVSEIVAEIDKIDRKIAELISDNLYAIQEVSEAIDALDDDLEKTILYGYLLAGRSMTAISNDIHYSRQHTYRIYQQAIKHVTNVTNGM